MPGDGQLSLSSTSAPVLLPLDVTEWTVSNVGTWLETHGYGTYAYLLCHGHRIDGAALLTLRERDLKEAPLSLPCLGDIKRLTASLRRLKRRQARYRLRGRDGSRLSVGTRDATDDVGFVDLVTPCGGLNRGPPSSGRPTNHISCFDLSTDADVTYLRTNGPLVTRSKDEVTLPGGDLSLGPDPTVVIGSFTCSGPIGASEDLFPNFSGLLIREVTDLGDFAVREPTSLRPTPERVTEGPLSSSPQYADFEWGGIDGAILRHRGLGLSSGGSSTTSSMNCSTSPEIGHLYRLPSVPVVNHHPTTSKTTSSAKTAPPTDDMALVTRRQHPPVTMVERAPSGAPLYPQLPAPATPPVSNTASALTRGPGLCGNPYVDRPLAHPTLPYTLPDTMAQNGIRARAHQVSSRKSANSTSSPFRSSLGKAIGSRQAGASPSAHQYECPDDRSVIFKAALALAYTLCAFLVTSFVMVVVDDRVPDITRYPPLPDIFLDNIPLIPGSFVLCEQIAILLGAIFVGVCLFHKYRFIILRRFCALTGTVFLLRCFTMVITSLSVPGSHLNCHNGQRMTPISVKVARALRIWSGFGMSLVGIHTCGDYMFSGHTVILTMLNFFITEYTPRSLYLLHTFSWVLNLFGIFFILAAHEHYSIDVFIAFYITTRLFLYYHSLANNRALRQGDRHRVKTWFPMFSFFESRVEGIVPNVYGLPAVIQHNFTRIPLVKFLLARSRSPLGNAAPKSRHRVVHYSDGDRSAGSCY